MSFPATAATESPIPRASTPAYMATLVTAVRRNHTQGRIYDKRQPRSPVHPSLIPKQHGNETGRGGRELLTMVVVPEWIKPHWQGEAKQEVDVSEHERPRVSVVQHGVQELVKLLTAWPHPKETDQLQAGGNEEGGERERGEREREGEREMEREN